MYGDMSDDDIMELERAAVAAMTRIITTPAEGRRTRLREIVSMYREDGTLGRYLEFKHPAHCTTHCEFQRLISETAMEMARERREKK